MIDRKVRHNNIQNVEPRVEQYNGERGTPQFHVLQSDAIYFYSAVDGDPDPTLT